MKKFLPVLLCFLPVLTSAQRHDNTTLLGYYGGWITPPGDNLGISVLTFPDGNLHIEENFELTMHFRETNTIISDSSGSLQLYCNGEDIMNAHWDTILNGASLTNDGPGPNKWPQLALALPKPGGDGNKVALLYGNEEIFYPFGQEGAVWIVSNNLYGAEIDMAKNQGAGEVISRGQVVIQDTLAMGKFTATKHANGRDWWILAHEQNTNHFYRVLLDPQGFHNLGRQTVGTNAMDGVGQACFSPNGEHYLMYDGITLDSSIGNFLNVYDFDRCTGLLSNHRQTNIKPGGWGGVAFSPNSRYFYYNNWNKAYQYDMLAPDIWASQTLIAVWDGYYSPTATAFMFMQLMPDGKVYSCTATLTTVLHVVQHPDEPAASCAYKQHAVHLPTRNSRSIPNFPNFRLGPVDGSSCDTLGLNNWPKAWYRYEQDTLDALHVDFHDLSSYEPATWSWDFGDGSPKSTERHPVHQYAAKDVYQVCLTVSNVNGSDTHCKTLYLGVSAQENPVLQSQVLVSPNPFVDRLSVALSANLRSPVFRLYDAMGHLVRSQPMAYGITEVEAGDLAAGMYFWEVLAGSERVKAGKVVR